MNNSRTAPGSNAPQTQAAPTSTPKSAPNTTEAPSGSSSTSPEAGTKGSEDGIVATVMELLMPLAKALGMDDTAITAELINLAYTLAAALFAPTD
ncbi:hypothetical protein [Nocardia cyriacigeorgica]|uniref:hypothetical protein n=1 Tax=Nocardia cyriacigeorgica TaxID=135487 RepID=UPI0024576888|nr:hypothetical protein [Nocardia cyriacigeorgica]